MDHTPKIRAKTETSKTVPLGQARMVRKQILLTPEQSRAMKALAAATGRTEADLFREAVDARLAAPPANDDWKAALLAAAGIWADHDSIDKHIAERRQSRMLRRTKMAGG
jgi:hypothetical protein